ncbi:hypothetical protein WJX73_008040 [Symbiochloris irregularis]|uniref:TerD domain-containing protein n=1 Tax=Symbiochloris irregularis TaxID=706552 RepID=A0AAW1P8D3_9CHLO
MVDTLPSPRDWISPAHSTNSPIFSPTRAVVQDDDMEDICNSMEKLLRKGERFQAPASLKYLSMKERWYWSKSEKHIRFLDASCLLFSGQGQFLEVIDYANRESTTTVGYKGAVRHSGDILFRGDYMGEHTIDVDLTCLAPCVREMYITISAFNEPPSFLSDIMQPTMTVVDRETQAALCSYEMEDQPEAVRAEYTSVTMCRVFRSAQNENVWEVEALGHMGHGSAGHYRAILHYIQEVLPMTRSLAGWGF